MTAKFVIVLEDDSFCSLALLYRGPYLVLEQQSKFSCLQLVTWSDMVSVDRIKPAFSDSPILAVPPLTCGCPGLHTPDPALCPHKLFVLPSNAGPAPVYPRKNLRY